MNILFACNNPDLYELYVPWLQGRGHCVTTALNAADAIEKWQGPINLVLMALPWEDGAMVCRERLMHSAMVLALAEDPRLETQWLNHYADAFLCLPFMPDLFLSYVAALTRRLSVATGLDTIAEAGDVQVYRTRNVVVVSGQSLHLTSIETKLLFVLVANANRVCTYDTIIQYVWGFERGQKDKIKSHIRHLRQKIEKDPKYPSYIQTINDVGYTFRTSRTVVEVVQPE